ncbi:nuclear transport factor 2 family protein [Ramlibacter terrae]|uniref:Nuclear transport factor 2 family protein n=1 Tax=Ramlibacter terrae TaxID=2732511 RepID=A0ABX6P5I2_9BURK|nr:nuclear transport factor 2 family protein [Ramlibacter terrae]
MERDIFEALLAADEARYQALYVQDVTALAGMLRDDYLHTHANGKTDDKDAFLTSIAAARYRFVRADRSEQRVRTAGAVALLSGHTATTLDMAGELKTIRNAFVTAWVREEGGWKLLHWQATKLPEG